MKRDIREEPASLCSDEMHAVLVSPIIDLQLLAQWCVGEDNDLLAVSTMYQKEIECYIPGNP